MLDIKELKFGTVYLEGLRDRFARNYTEDITYLHRQGISKPTASKYALLHDGKHPTSFDKILKGPAFKQANKRILFPYYRKDIVTSVGILCGGGVEIKPLCKLEGAFLGKNLNKSAHVCQTEFEALLLRQLGIKDATVLTAPRALTYKDPAISLVDAGASLSVGQALTYKRLYTNVNILFFKEPLSKFSRKSSITKEASKAIRDFYKWLSTRIMKEFLEDQEMLRYELEQAEISDEEFERIISALDTLKHTDIIIEWLRTIDRSAKTINVRGTKFLQTEAGWSMEGDPVPLTDFRLVITKVKDVKKTRWADCILYWEGEEYSMELPLSKLNTRQSLDFAINNYFNDIGKPNPQTDCGVIPIKGVTWLKLAYKFSKFEVVITDYTALGVEDFAELYNKIFTDTKWVKPTTQSFFTRNSESLGYKHHKSGDLWLSKSRMIHALKELTNTNITTRTLDNCFGDEVEKRTNNIGTFYVFPPAMVQETDGIIEFRIA
jgi:hypothetical protein